MTRKGAAIARVSGKSQKDNTSPEGQLERIRQYARQNDIALVQEFKEIESGGVILARAFNPKSPVYTVLEMARRGEIECVVFDVADRIGRGEMQPIFEFMFQQAGATVLYAAPGHDKDSLAGFVAHQADALVSGVERLRIRERMTTGKVNAVKRGQMLGVGRPPYGYDYERTFDALGRRLSTKLIPIESGRQVYLRMVRMVMEDGMSSRAIAKRLTAENVPAPDVRHGKREVGALWRSSSIMKILRNPVYGGRWYYGRIETKSVDTQKGRKSRQVRVRGLDEIPYIEVEGFVSWDEWQALQDKLDTHGDLFVKPTKYQYLLRGVIRCAACGYVLCGTPTHHRNGTELYYRCRHGRHKPDEPCASRPINAGDAEQQVWAQFVAWVMEAGGVERVAGQVSDGGAVAGLEAALVGLERQKKALNDELRRVLRAYAKVQAGTTLSVFEEEQARISSDQQRVEAEMANVREQIRAAREQVARVAGAGELREQMAAALAGGVDVPFEMRRKWLRAAGLAGVWDSASETLSIACVFGSADLRLKRYASRRRGNSH